MPIDNPVFRDNADLARLPYFELREGRTLALATDVMIGVAVAAAASTLLTYFLTRKKERVRANTLVLPSCGSAGRGCGLRHLRMHNSRERSYRVT